MIAHSLQSLSGIFRRPLVRITLLFLVFVTLFVVLLQHDSLPFSLETIPFVLPRPLPNFPLPIPPRPDGLPLHRIKIHRPQAVPAHGGPWAERADAVRDAFLHAYNGYLTYAAPHDELLPLSKSPYDMCVYPLLCMASAPAD